VWKKNAEGEREAELEGKKSYKREGESSRLGTHPLDCMGLLFCFFETPDWVKRNSSGGLNRSVESVKLWLY